MEQVPIRLLSSVLIAAHAASGVLAEPTWPFDAAEDEQGSRDLALLAGFVRDNPTAPVEALWIHAAARGVGRVQGDVVPSWAEVPIEMRLAFALFAQTLLSVDRLLDEEAGRLEELTRLVLAAEAGPVPAAALAADPDDTIMRLHPDPLETMAGRTLQTIEPAGDADPVGEALDEPGECDKGETDQGDGDEFEGEGDGEADLDDETPAAPPTKPARARRK